MNNVKRKPFIILLITAACAFLIAAGIIAGGSRKNQDSAANVSPVSETAGTSASETAPTSSADIMEDDKDTVADNAGIEIPADNQMENNNKEAVQPKEETPGNSTGKPKDPEQPKEETPDDGGNEAVEDGQDIPEDARKNENGDIELSEIH